MECETSSIPQLQLLFKTKHTSTRRAAVWSIARHQRRVADKKLP